MAQCAADRLQKAVVNLLAHCAGLEPGARLLVVGEEKQAGYYDGRIAETVARVAADQGYRTAVESRPFCTDVAGIDEPLASRMAAVDCTLFFARLGDQLRFRDMPPGSRSVVCYTLDIEALCSGFGTAHYQAFLDLKRAIDQMIGAADHIRVTCPRGTDFSVTGPAARPDCKADVSIIRFPMSVFARFWRKISRAAPFWRGFWWGQGRATMIPMEGACSAPSRRISRRAD